MKVMQRFPLEHWARIQIDAEDARLKWRYESLISGLNREFRYEEIDPRPERIKRGEPGAQGASLICFILAAVLSIIFDPLDSLFGVLTLCFLVFMMLLFFAAQFRKTEFIYFSDKDKQPAFYFNADKNPELVEYILGRISHCRKPEDHARPARV